MTANWIEKGVYAASLTPLRPDLSCDDERLLGHCRQLVDKGCKGVVLFGTTGEGASFSVDERVHVLRQVISRGMPAGQVILGNGSSCLQDTVALAKAAVENGCLASLIAPPCFFKAVSEEGVLSFYREVIKRVSAPSLRIILYHIPQLTGVPMTVPIVEKLCSEFPGTVIGIKESEGNPSFAKAILTRIPQCQVFVGRETDIPSAVEQGASGTICGMANLWPKLICSVYEGRDLPELEQKTRVVTKYPFIPSCKALLAAWGDPAWNVVCPPLVPLTAEQNLEISSAATIP